MRITKVNIPQGRIADDGLGDIKMGKLGRVVLLAGKNGSGKTRILNKVFSALSNKPNKVLLTQSADKVKQYQDNLEALHSSLLKTQIELDRGVSNEVPLITHIENTKRQIGKYTDRLNQTKYHLDWDLIETSELAESYSAIHFVPKTLNLQDSNNYGRGQLLNMAASINGVGIENLPGGTFAKIQVIQDRWFNCTHQFSQVDDEERASAIEQYNKLLFTIEVFLNVKLDRNADGDATIFGFPLGKSNLSDGQKILLQFCIAIYSQEANLKDLILIMDEPENHLHPLVIIETIDRILSCVSNGQVWIATHSLPLLAHFDPSCVWFVEDNKISHAGKIPEKVLRSLLGNDDDIAKLQDFISLPALYAASRYAFESLFEPVSLITDSKDPQSIQIRENLISLSESGRLRVLDFGAGKCRLLSNLFDLDSHKQEGVLQRIDYIAYDKFNIDRNSSEEVIIRAYGTAEKRYYNDMDLLLCDYDKASFDVIIMCNVLHEIDPKDWLKLFGKNGRIPQLLTENGRLLLVEDHQMPIGEKAYQKGFLVLNTPQLKELFKISEADSDFYYHDQKSDGRLKAHQIPKRLLIRIDETTRLLAIKSLSNTAREKLLEIREMEKNYVNGKLHGFWTQQFANAELNIKEFTT